MKRKRVAKTEPGATEAIVAPEILEDAKRSLVRERVAKPVAVKAKCVVCASDVAPGTIGANEQLCWVCRRLKISAWRESEQQPTVQE
jgi:hypothetical protein